MKAITIRDPWCRAIAAGAKTVENRGRPTSHRGPIAIHASKTVDLYAYDDPRIIHILGSRAFGRPAMGAVVAVADLVDCHPALDFGRGGKTCCEPWGEKYHANAKGVVRAHRLVLANVRALRVPIHTRGAVMVPWNLPEDVAAAVSAHLAETAGA